MKAIYEEHHATSRIKFFQAKDQLQITLRPLPPGYQLVVSMPNILFNEDLAVRIAQAGLALVTAVELDLQRTGAVIDIH
ncbi:MAG: hypothetical protein CL797_06245 [Chromatiales bacterium]|nr:hypothetical protein [Chromatiales bacterium]